MVPVFKVEKYLSRCVESLINQTFNSIEIILVDDDSPDSCPEMCDRYAKIDFRIKALHIENLGVSHARNIGIQEAIGKYILLVDSDDYIDIDTCEQFINVIGDKNPDIVVGNGRRIENDNEYPIQHSFVTPDKVVSGMEYLRNELKTGNMHMMVWLNLYNRDFLQINKLQYRVGYLHEDEEFTPRAFLKAEKVIGTDIIFYNYIIRGGSLTTQENKIENAEYIMKICNEYEKLYSEIKDDELRRLLNNNLVDLYLNIFQVARLYKKKYNYLINKSFLRGKAYTKRNKLRVALFMFNKRVYYFINKISKLLSLRFS